MTWLRLIWIVVVVILFCDRGSAWGRRRRRCDSTPCKWHWSTCSKTCGGGTQYPIKTQNQGSCGSCNMPSGTRPCNTQCCRLDCSWNSWGSWQSCSVSCGGGTQKRTRTKYGPSCGGTDCPGPSQESRQCNAQCCPVDCQWSSWVEVGECTATCGTGQQARDRHIIVYSSCNGEPCSGPTSDIITCNTQCCRQDCVWEAWGVWSTCDKTCGTGIQHRERGEEIHASCGGSECVGSYADSQSCNTQCCSYDCIWDVWSTWSECTKTCGNGEHARSRNVTQMAVCGGTDCTGEVCETLPCNEFCCPADCFFGDWSQWTRCDVTCGGGSRNRERTLEISDACSSQVCHGDLNETESCNTHCCPVDCQLSQWSPWSDCTATCGNLGTQYRNRQVEQEMECGGNNCSTEVYQNQSCNLICFNEGSVMTTNGCQCGTGWEGKCCELDIDECENVTCPANSDCFNTDGSFECVCHDNYTKEGEICIHYDKCLTGRHDCSINGECTMLPDRENYICECNPGYSGNGLICLDIDECLEDQEQSGDADEGEYSGEQIITEWYPLCHRDGNCINTEGSYICVCDDGYVGDGLNCSDLDECSLHEAMLNSSDTNNTEEYCSQHASCNNSIGSYSCSCKVGYFGDGKQCQDIDDCDPNPCQHGLCHDLVNNFECFCTDGYEGELCEIDIDECETGVDNCNRENGTCINTIGSFVCECKGGYEGDGFLCQDIDECERGTDNCEGNFPICVNTPGSYSCDCQPGSSLVDGVLVPAAANPKEGVLESVEG